METEKLIIQNCDKAISNLRRAIAYASNLPSSEYGQLKGCLESSLLEAQKEINSAIASFNDLDCPFENNSIATLTEEESF